MKTRILILTLVVLLMMSVFFGCAQPVDEKPAENSQKDETPVESSDDDAAIEPDMEGIKIGFSIQDISNPVWVTMWEHMQHEADQLGVEIVLSDAQADPLKQISALENFVEAGYDAIIVHCFDVELANDVL